MELTSANFDSVIENEKGKVVVDFWAPWCGPCRMIAGNLEEAVDETPNAKLFKVNVDSEPELADRFNINAIPALIVFEGGKVVNSATGYMGKEQIKSLLK